MCPECVSFRNSSCSSPASERSTYLAPTERGTARAAAGRIFKRRPRVPHGDGRQQMADSPAAETGTPEHHSSTLGARRRFLPPYSPDFNPIEQAFAKLKAFLRAARPLAAGLGALASTVPSSHRGRPAPLGVGSRGSGSSGGRRSSCNRPRSSRGRSKKSGLRESQLREFRRGWTYSRCPSPSGRSTRLPRRVRVDDRLERKSPPPFREQFPVRFRPQRAFM